MSRAQLIYPVEKDLQRQRERFIADPNNSEILSRYYKVRMTQVKPMTVLAEFVRLNEISCIFGKRFEDVSVKDAEDLIYMIDGKDNSDSTKNKYRKVLKSFFRWLKMSPPGQFPSEVQWIRLKKVPLITVKESDLITYDEAMSIGEHATNLRDKALFHCKLDAGCRMGEILTVKVGEVQFNEFGAVLNSDGKTGEQPLILTWSSKVLAIWLNNHPFRNDSESPLWPILGRDVPRQLSYAAALRNFKKCVKKTGIKKRVWPHLLKHVSCSMDSTLGMSDPYRKYKHHWTPNSRMPQVYEHLSKSIIANIQRETLQRQTGLMLPAVKIPEERIDIFKHCNRCEFENPRDAIYCNQCAFPLKEREQFEKSLEQVRLDTAIGKIRDDPEKMEKIISMIG